MGVLLCFVTKGTVRTAKLHAFFTIGSEPTLASEENWKRYLEENVTEDVSPWPSQGDCRTPREKRNQLVVLEVAPEWHHSGWTR